MKKNVRTLTLAIAALLVGTMGFAGVESNSVAVAYTQTNGGGVTNSQIVRYMSTQGIVVVTIEPIPGTANRLVTANTGKKYIVYVSGGKIVGYEEQPQG